MNKQNNLNNEPNPFSENKNSVPEPFNKKTSESIIPPKPDNPYGNNNYNQFYSKLKDCENKSYDPFNILDNDHFERELLFLIMKINHLYIISIPGMLKIKNILRNQ